VNFDDLKEKIMTSLKSSWESFQETNLYYNIKDRYENLTPMMQKLTLAGIVGLVVLMFLSYPWSVYQDSADSVASYEDKRMLIRDLLKTARDSQERPNLASAPDATSVQSQIQSRFMSAGLLPEQIKGVEVVSEKSNLIPDSNVSALIKINLAKLNLRQIIDLGFQIQNINSSVKMKDISIEASRELANYFDVVYNLVILNVPDFSATPTTTDEPEAKPSRAKKGDK
jgi:hypothetical protein